MKKASKIALVVGVAALAVLISTHEHTNDAPSSDKHLDSNADDLDERLDDRSARPMEGRISESRRSTLTEPPLELGVQASGEIDARVGAPEYPITVASSVRPVCSGPALGVDCEDEARLRRFSEERRDAAWAMPVEGALKEMIQNESDEFTIRGLECRRTLCLVEVQSARSDLRRKLSPEDWYRLEIEPIGSRTGEEEDAGNLPLTISLWIYERRNWKASRPGQSR
jgi:hypothetical protein